MNLGKQSVVILLVDDDPGHRLLVRENLESAGVVNKIDEFKNGKEVIEYLEASQRAEAGRERPGLILLDINMPVIDGYGVLEYVKKEAAWSRIPVLMLTSTDDQREINRCYEFGANGYIVKPVSYGAFQQRIKALGMYLDIVCLPH